MKTSSAVPSCMLLYQDHVDEKLDCSLLHIIMPEHVDEKLLGCPLLHIICQNHVMKKTPQLSPPAYYYILLCQNYVHEKLLTAVPFCILFCQNHVDEKLLSYTLLHIVMPESC